MSQEGAIDSSDEAVTSSMTSRRAAVDVLVYSSVRSIQDRLKLMRLLWQAGVRAEIDYERNPALTMQEIEVRVRFWLGFFGALIVLNFNWFLFWSCWLGGVWHYWRCGRFKFDYSVGHIGHRVANGSPPLRSFAKPRRWTPALVTRFGVIPRCSED